MPRPKKDWKTINLNVARNVTEAFEKYAADVGQSKTAALERIIQYALREYYKQPEGNREPIK